MALFIGYATVPSNTEPWVIAVLWWGSIVSGVSFFLIGLVYLSRIVNRHLINRKDAMRSNYYAGFVDVGKVRAGANLRVVAKVGDYISDTATTNTAGYYNSLEVKPPNASYKGLPIQFYVEGKKVSKTEDYMGGGHSPNFWNLEYEPEIKDKGKQRQQEPIPLQNDIRQVVEELRSLSIFDGIPIDATRVLYQLREQLAVGISEYQVQGIEKPILAQLALRKIVTLEQRRKASGPRQYDEGYWILTEFGKEVIRYLETNQQVLDTEGSQPLGDGIQPIMAEPEVSVNIDKSSVLNYGQQSKAIKYGQLSQQGQAIEVAFTVNVKNPPVNIADLQMCMGKQILKRFSHDIREPQRTNKECYTARFEPLKPDMLKILKQKDRSPDKYQLFVVVDDKSWPSKYFPINYP